MVAQPPSRRLLTINVGSSSLKAVLYRVGEDATPEVRASAERIGAPSGCLRLTDGQGKLLAELAASFRDHASAVGALLRWLGEHQLDNNLSAIGHRVVHGGPRYSAPTLIADAVIDELRSLI